MPESSGVWLHKRRYPRIVIPHEKGDLHRIVGIQVRLPSGQIYPVIDLSYLGAALLVESENKFHKIGEQIPLEFLFEAQNLKPIQSEVVRTSKTAVGVRFCGMSPETRLEFDRLMNDKMLGLNTHKVRVDLLNPRDRRHDLTSWYHGPRDTNIFIWSVKEQIYRFIVELDYQSIEFDKGDIIYSTTVPETEFFRQGYSGYLEVKGSSNVSFSQTELAKRIINILSAIPEKGPEIHWVIETLVERVKM